MKHDIIWSKDAGDEFADIISYIKYHTGKMTANKISDKIINGIEHIVDNPEGRRLAPILQKMGITDIHQLNIAPWAVYYKVENNVMEIISIIDQRRNAEFITSCKPQDLF
jgi:plasmid stabilization system protein ParE